MKGYMASGEFARGKESIRAEGGMTFLGNFQVDVAHQLRAGHLLSPMPEAMRDDTAFMDRLHAYVPGWDIPAMGRDQKTHHYGLVSDLLAQWWHDLRSENRYVRVGQRIAFNTSWRGRDVEAVEKTVDGLLKLLYPDPDAAIDSEDIDWAMELATVARRRVKEAQAAIGAEEFGEVDLGYSLDGGAFNAPQCPESLWRRPDVDDEFPSLGPVVARPESGLPAKLPDPLPPGFPLVGFGLVVDQPRGAQGAFGTVYRVKRDFDGRILAGKLFRKDPSAPYPEMADRALRQEVKALESLTHPNIVRVLGPIPVTSQGEWMIVSEWIDGSTLDDFTDGPKAMNGAAVFQAGTQLLAALTYLEERGVVHRDLKPANVMIDSGGSLKLIDFNLTRDTGRETMVAGTPAYMPPDFLAQASSTDSFVDRYGVAVMLYQLIAGQHPYASSLIGGKRPTFSTPPTDPRTLRPELSNDLAAFMVRSVAPQESERFGTAYEMAEAWAALSDDINRLA